MSDIKRREFLSRALMTTCASAAFSSLPLKLALAQASADIPAGARLVGTDYRALVCLYLYGGNDSFNTVIPTDSNYTNYYNRRKGNGVAGDPSNLAVPQGQLLALNPTQGPLNGGAYGLHPVMTGTKAMFDAGRCAIIGNVGPLVRPTTKANFNQIGWLLPPQLFSHSDQSVLWQTPSASSTDRNGWGGKLADYFYATNTNQVLSMNVSLDGDNVFQSGAIKPPYFLSTYGAEQIDSINTGNPNCLGTQATYNRRRCETFRDLQANRNSAGNHIFEQAYVDKVGRAIAISAQVSTAIAAFPENDAMFRPFWDAFGLAWTPNSTDLPDLPRLAAQLLMIARVIRARATLQMSRQLFFAGIGGFDNHDTQNADQPNLLKDLSQSVKAFYEVLDAMDPILANRVTAFTASDFGRTLTNNGDGTDHGWGGHHFVFGGSVRGNRMYGKMPSLLETANNPDDLDYGRIIPTLSADQYAATLADWYGLPTANRDAIFGNLQYMTGSAIAIAGPNLGFMNPVV
jgi:uncharacterized protein (DUF1501 family)